MSNTTEQLALKAAIGYVERNTPQLVHSEIAAELRRLAAENAALHEDVNELRGVMQSVRRTLDDANQIPNGPICDTIWYTPHETLFDFIDAAMQKETP